MKFTLKTVFMAICSIATGLILWATVPFNMAISSFENVTVENTDETTGKQLALRIEEKLKDSTGVQLRASGAVEKYIKMLELSQAGVISPSVVDSRRSILDVDHISVGSIARIGSMYEIDSRLVNVNNWEIEYACGFTTGSIDYAVESILEKYRNHLASIKADQDEDKKEPARVTVYRFRESNENALARGYGNVLSEIINSELGSRKGLATVERKYSKSLINEKVLRMTGVVENDNSTSLFNNRRIQYELTGELRVFDDLICIRYTLRDTASGMCVLPGYHEISSPRYLRPLAASIASDLAGVISNEAGVLQIKCKEKSINVILDGEPLGNVRKLRLGKGNYQLKVAKPGFSNFEKTVVIKPGSTVAIPVALKGGSNAGQKDEGDEDSSMWKPEWEKRVWKAQETPDQ